MLEFHQHLAALLNYRLLLPAAPCDIIIHSMGRAYCSGSGWSSALSPPSSADAAAAAPRSTPPAVWADSGVGTGIGGCMGGLWRVSVPPCSDSYSRAAVRCGRLPLPPSSAWCPCRCRTAGPRARCSARRCPVVEGCWPAGRRGTRNQ